ncbi:MAG: hypothetical protein BRD23_08805 [Halobacteriales archaeon SW_9_67_25]|nr:MAG: hypothetical protein BRD23_08805 [Halobacteriales archaeon SW_9_67_25]
MQENGNQTTGDSSAEGIDPSSVTDRQRETLRFVHDHLGVSRATVSRRLNDVPGFEWTDREAFTSRVFGEDSGVGGDSETSEGHAGSPDGDDSDRGTVAGNGGPVAVSDDGGDEISSAEGATSGEEPAIDALGGAAAGGRSIRIPPELAHKVLHACMHSDRITEDEELRLIAALLEG